MSERRALAIGEVIDLLLEEFPDVSISKLRFLESQGLIRPTRSSSGYRQFRAADVERIRYILRQQRDHFLPAQGDQGQAERLGARRGTHGVARPPAPCPRSTSAAPRRACRRTSWPAPPGSPSTWCSRLLEHGVLDRRRGKGGEPEFGEDDAAVARAAQRLVARGLEPRHVKSLCLASHREVDLLSPVGRAAAAAPHPGRPPAGGRSPRRLRPGGPRPAGRGGPLPPARAAGGLSCAGLAALVLTLASLNPIGAAPAAACPSPPSRPTSPRCSAPARGPSTRWTRMPSSGPPTPTRCGRPPRSPR